MAAKPRPQRVRDPVHNLIEFGTDQFEEVMWRVIQTPPFQRLRRIKQLGFSDLVYPGATHTRFAHCIGVFHTARQLMRIIQRELGARQFQFQDHQAQVALAAALVHDLGHGMFSHAFEDVGKTMGLEMAHHESVSDRLIRDSEVSDVFKELGSGFANDVANVIQSGRPGNLYNAVVSSQFDADRLDYMQRDRLLTGVQNSAIDFTWLMSNLEIATVGGGVDTDSLGDAIDTFVIGPKAVSAAETYVLALFQLYPTVYFHKTTRGIEKMFSASMSRVLELARNDNSDRTGLPGGHPLVEFATHADSLDHALALDDTVFWGSLPLLAHADDALIRDLALRLRERRLLRCIDLRERLLAAWPSGRAEAAKKLERPCERVAEILQSWSAEKSTTSPRILIDHAERDPYRRLQESKGPLNQIRTRTANGDILDLAEFSATVAAIEKFHLFRAYIDRDDTEAMTIIEQTIEQVTRSNHHDE